MWTITFTVPVPAGDTAVIMWLLSTWKLFAGVVPKSTAVTCENLHPEIVTDVPPFFRTVIRAQTRDCRGLFRSDCEWSRGRDSPSQRCHVRLADTHGRGSNFTGNGEGPGEHGRGAAAQI